jgi:DNA-binding MarR family transcriptional regulator
MPSPAPVDRESIARSEDHRALRIWLRLLTCTQLIERQVRSRLREKFATTLPRFDLMAQLERQRDGLKMNELSRMLMVTGGNITAIVDQLEHEGLVERLDDAADRRAFRIRLTRTGERTFAEMARAHEEWVVELLAGLSRREQEELLKLLAKVKQHTVGVRHEPAEALPVARRGQGRRHHAEPAGEKESPHVRVVRRAARFFP